MLSHLVPSVLEQLIHFLKSTATGLRDHDKDIDEGNETPSSEEHESSPLVHRCEDVRSGLRDGKEEEPVETLRKSSTE